MSIADKVDNASVILVDLVTHAEEASDDVCWYYASLARAFNHLHPGPRADELTRPAGELSRHNPG